MPAMATWSIVIIDTKTREIALGSATCLTSFDLQKGAGVMLVEVGAGQAQSAVDQNGTNRRTMWDEMLAGTEPRQIIRILRGKDPSHQSRQYGIADIIGRTTTFTGSGAGKWAGGLVGEYGTLVYAIQGNVLTGEPVIVEAEKAIRNAATDGDLPAKLMAAMEAARSMGGDGRCSCNENDPDGCGSPPKNFTKSAHIGYMIIARSGDADGTCNLQSGCANGDYFLNFNIAFQQNNSEDPVKQMQKKFDTFRTSSIGRPDAIRSTVELSADTIAPDGSSQVVMTITLRDWQGQPVTSGAPVTVAHASDSAKITQIGDVTDHGNGVYSVVLTAGATVGVDRFWVSADDGTGAVRIMPWPELTSRAATFEYPYGLPEFVPPTGAARIVADTQAVGEHPAYDSVKLVIVGDDGETEIGMTDIGGVYQAEFPATTCGEAVKYYLRAKNANGDSAVDPLLAPAETFVAISGGSRESRFGDDFESDKGWKTELNGATSGKWDRGTPVNDTGYQYDPPFDSDFSGKCFVTDNRKGSSDVDGGPPRLISPTLDMSGGYATLRYDYFLRLTSSGKDDRIQVEVSDNDGAEWVEVASHNQNDVVWRPNVITQGELEAAGLTVGATMKVRFSAVDATPDSTVEAGIDAFSLSITHCEPARPRGDLNCDGLVSFMDIDAFVAALIDEVTYRQDNPTCDSALGDVNCDAAVNFDDIDAFVACLVDGACPECP